MTDMLPAKRFQLDPYTNAITVGYVTGLAGEDPDPQLENYSEYADGWLMGCADREAGKKLPKYLGFSRDADLPVKQGQEVTILKGTVVRCNGVTKQAGRTYKVKIHHILSGTNIYVEGNAFRRELHPMTSPTICWAGTGGYWAEADLNDIPEAQ